MHRVLDLADKDLSELDVNEAIQEKWAKYSTPTVVVLSGKTYAESKSWKRKLIGGKYPTSFGNVVLKRARQND